MRGILSAQLWPSFFASWRIHGVAGRGEKKWNSLEGDLTIACLHDGVGHIELNFTIRKFVVWTVNHSIEVSAGELEDLTKNVSAFFDIEKVERN